MEGSGPCRVPSGLPGRAVLQPYPRNLRKIGSYGQWSGDSSTAAVGSC